MQLIELSFLDLALDAVENEVYNFFEALKDLASVQKVKVSLLELKQQIITEILVENNTRANIHQLLEF